MAKNIFVTIPSVGDAVVGEIASKKIKFIAASSFSAKDLDPSVYETIGVVYARHGRQVKFAYKHNEAKKWATKMVVEIKGAQTDGVQHTGTISYRPNAEASTNTDVVVSYTATTLQQVADAINAAIAGQPSMIAQHWHAYIENGLLVVSYDYIYWQQWSYNEAKDGFTMNKEYWFKDIPYYAKLRRKNGRIDGEGAICSMDKAVQYYASSVGAASYEGNVDNDIANLDERGYPINKSSYLGQSADGKDHCAALRAKYGEGEQGWLNCLKSFEAVCPTDAGNLGLRNGYELTKALASYRDGYGKSFAPAAEYCLSASTAVLPAGSFYLPTCEDIYDLMSAVKYSTSPLANCAINATLQAMQGSYISNGSHWWSCCRCNWYNAFISNGNYGFLGLNEFYYPSHALPVSLYYIED